GLRAGARAPTARRFAQRRRLWRGHARRAACRRSRSRPASPGRRVAPPGRRVIHALPPAIVAGELVRLQTRQRVVALTFDGGGNADAAQSVLAILKRERVPGTFFLTGHFVQTYPLLSRAIGRRYPVANHTVDHLDLRRLPTPAAIREITRAEWM